MNTDNLAWNHNIKILVIEDSTFQQEALKRQLPKKCDVKMFLSVETAIDFLHTKDPQEWYPHVILCDLIMKEGYKSGHTFIQWFSKFKFKRPFCWLAAITSGNDEAQTCAMQEGAYSTMKKPLHSELLMYNLLGWYKRAIMYQDQVEALDSLVYAMTLLNTGGESNEHEIDEEFCFEFTEELDDVHQISEDGRIGKAVHRAKRSKEEIYREGDKTITNISSVLTNILQNDFVKLLQLRKEERKILEKALDEARRANQAKSGFLANVSHEIRSPLNVITMGLELCMMYTNASEINKEKLINRILVLQNSGAQLAGLIDDLLDHSKMLDGKLSYTYDINNLSYVVESAIAEIDLKLKEKNVTVNFISRRAEHYFDEKRLLQVFRNLLSNSIKFSPIDGTITIEITREEKNYIISVTDEGNGIPEGEEELIFQPFEQSSDTSNVGGTGLGLSICTQIVKSHNGTIYAMNNETKGAKFEIKLPLNFTGDVNDTTKATL